MSASTSETANAAALAKARTRSNDLTSTVLYLDQQLRERRYAEGDRQKLETLKADLRRAGQEVDAEIAARQRVQQAYDDSSYAKKDADPDVLAAQKSLAAVRKDSKPVMRGKDNLVNAVCASCLVKDINAVMDCDTPYYVTYGKSGGPTYKQCNAHPLKSFSGWDDLVKSNVKTSSEKNVLVVMSANEGGLDDVQAYDSEILTMGAMQKTVSPTGQGELPTQLRTFRDDPSTAAVFRRELGDKGFSIGPLQVGKKKDGSPKFDTSDTLYFTDPSNPKATPITGAALDTFIQTHKDRWADTLGPFRSLGRTPEFQRRQVLDFNDRLVGALGKQPKGYGHDIGEFVTSERGGALVLDQHVNRPGFVQTDFGAALDSFYKANPKVSRDPSTWPAASRDAWENQILDNYTAVRRGTDMPGRATKLAGQGLSTTAGSLDFPEP